MTLYEIIFILLSSIILIFSFMTVLSRRILRSATYLLFVLLATALIYGWLEYQFMAAVQVALYAGGIVVIIVFSILLTHHIHEKSLPIKPIKLFIGFGLAMIGAAITVTSILNHDFGNKEAAEINVTVKSIGKQLTETQDNGYALPFEVISLLLLAALIGAIIVAKKDSNTNIEK